MTVKKAKVISAIDKGYSTECSGPGRTVYQLEPVNCPLSQFMDWFTQTPIGQSFIVCGEDLIVDVGGNPEIQPGLVLTVTFEEYFSSWINTEVEKWRKDSEIAWACIAKTL